MPHSEYPGSCVPRTRNRKKSTLLTTPNIIIAILFLTSVIGISMGGYAIYLSKNVNANSNGIAISGADSTFSNLGLGITLAIFTLSTLLLLS